MSKRTSIYLVRCGEAGHKRYMAETGTETDGKNTWEVLTLSPEEAADANEFVCHGTPFGVGAFVTPTRPCKPYGGEWMRCTVLWFPEKLADGSLRLTPDVSRGGDMPNLHAEDSVPCRWDGTIYFPNAQEPVRVYSRDNYNIPPAARGTVERS